MNGKKQILVYAHWQGFEEPVLMGTLVATSVRGNEHFEFEYATSWINTGNTFMLDPDLQLYPGRYYPKNNKPNFGIFLDSSPDRWGRVLMERREQALARRENRKTNNLLESDFLLGVYDGHRMGALRFKSEAEGVFLNNDTQMSTPPFTSLRELEYASNKFESADVNDEDYLKWIGMLIAPGASLGGARPKASVLDPGNQLWVAKFPSIKDRKDVGAWELVVNVLAEKAGLNVAKGMARKFNSDYHTYLSRRFDRNEKGERIHFASAMTMLGYSDGDNYDSGASYLEIMEFLVRNGADVKADLRELWSRIVFNICIKNTDDHLRNHGFLLTKAGWTLAPAYDINPNEYGTGLSLNISENDNSLDLDLALSVAESFRLAQDEAKIIIHQITLSVRQWRDVARQLGVSRQELDAMTGVFL